MFEKKKIIFGIEWCGQIAGVDGYPRMRRGEFLAGGRTCETVI